MIEDDLLNLRILSKIPENGKIGRGINGILAIDSSTSYASSVVRYIQGHSRSQSIRDIERVIDSSIYTVKELYNSKFYDDELYPVEYNKRKDKITKFHQAMGMGVDGLYNLRKTYESDVTSSSRIDILIDKVKFFIAEYETFI